MTFVKQPVALINNTQVNRGDLVKVVGVYGKFKFDSLVTNDRGDTWVDIFELDSGGCRSLDVKKIKVIHGKRARASVRPPRKSKRNSR